MKYFVIIPTLLASVFLLKTNCHAQQIVSPAGDYYSNSNISLSWSVGEPLISTFSYGEYNITHGFHQPKLTVTSIFEHELYKNAFSVYPNPARDVLNVKSETFADDCYIILTDNSGIVIFNQKVQKGFQNQVIYTENLAQGTYHLRIISTSGTLVQSFKIVKI